MGINPYALDYPICIDYSNVEQYGFLSSMGKASFLSPQGSRLLEKTNPKVKQVLDNYEPCAFDYLTEYLSRDDVQDVIHAVPTETWEVCSDAIYYGWDNTFWDRCGLPQIFISVTNPNRFFTKNLIFSVNLIITMN